MHSKDENAPDSQARVSHMIIMLYRPISVCCDTGQMVLDMMIQANKAP